MFRCLRCRIFRLCFQFYLWHWHSRLWSSSVTIQCPKEWNSSEISLWKQQTSSFLRKQRFVDLFSLQHDRINKYQNRIRVKPKSQIIKFHGPFLTEIFHCEFLNIFKHIRYSNFAQKSILKSEYLIWSTKFLLVSSAICYLLFRSISDLTMCMKSTVRFESAVNEMCFTLDYWQSTIDRSKSHPFSSTQAEQSCPWEVSWQHIFCVLSFLVCFYVLWFHDDDVIKCVKCCFGSIPSSFRQNLILMIIGSRIWLIWKSEYPRTVIQSQNQFKFSPIQMLNNKFLMRINKI